MRQTTVGSSGDTFADDIAQAMAQTLQARVVLASANPQFEELQRVYREELYGKILSSLRTLLSSELDDNTPIPDDCLPLLMPAIEQLMDEGIFRSNWWNRSHAFFLSRLLALTSTTDRVDDFHLTVTRTFDCLGFGLCEPVSLSVDGNCGYGTGRSMTGGTLIVNGDVTEWEAGVDSPFREQNHGRIEHNKTLIWDDGPTEHTPGHRADTNTNRG